MSKRVSRWPAFASGGVLIISLGLSFSTPASAQMEREPNDPCPSAQNFGAIQLPFSLEGNLDSSIQPDVDFFRIRATAGSRLRIDLQGSDSGHGSLSDPYLGAFDSNCNLLDANDDSDSLDSRLDMTVPANGILILGATECCDDAFEGGGNGTYLLTVQESTSIDSIRGRLVDADTGDPLSGSFPTDARAELRFCETPDCSSYDSVADYFPDEDGVFLFQEGCCGEPLEPGRYQVYATAQGYEDAASGPFDVAAGEAYDLGDVGLHSIPSIASISGRVVDAVTGEPIQGLTDFVEVALLLCDEDFCSTMSFTELDSDSRFSFTESFSGVPLPVGTYIVAVSADQYDDAETEPFEVGEGETYDTGDIGLFARTIAFSDVVPCKRVPREGGPCQFRVKVTNRLSNGLFHGRAWALVDGSGIGSVLDDTTFQIDRTADVSLRSGESKVVRFGFRVPGTVDNGADLCLRAYAGESTPNAFFGTVGTADLFCIRKGQSGDYTLVPKAEAHQLFDRIHGRHDARKRSRR